MATVTSKGIVTPRRTVADWIAGALVIVGALNWGLVGILRFDLVAALLGANSIPTKAVYVLVALAGIYCLTMALKTSQRSSLARP